MPKIVVEQGMVLNLGGYIVENVANLDCVDVIIGNPLKHDVKLKAPVYCGGDLEEYERAGMIVRYLREGERLSEKLEHVRQLVKEAK